MNNVFANVPGVIVAKVDIDFVAAGLDSSNTAIIYLIGSPLLSWEPGRDINAISGFMTDKGYYIVPKIDMDLTAITMPPTAAPPFDFLTYPGLAAFYDMTDPANVVVTSGRASKLKDLSAHGRDIQSLFSGGTFPPYSATGGISNKGFITLGDGANDGMLNAATGITGAVSVYAVIRFKGFTRTDVPGQGIVKTAVGFNSRISGIYMDDLDAGGPGYAPAIGNGGGLHWSGAYSTMKTTSWQIINIDSFQPYGMGVRVNNQSAPFNYLGGAPAIGASQIWLGYATGGLAANFELAALAIINGTPSKADENNIYAYLDAHYPVTKKQWFEVYGDSISSGNEGDFSIWPWLVSADRSYDLVSRSHGGTLVFPNNGSTGVSGQNMIDVYSYSFERPYTGQWVVFAFGTNDANQGGINATWKSTYKGYLQQFIDFGYPVGKMIIVKAPSTSARQSLMAPCFAYIDQIGSELGIHVYDANARFLANGGDSLFGDTLHPNGTGNRVYADGIELIIT